ncbi:MAG: SMC family ATPase [Actinomycetaceae bacterium]|nr:SMC family ATPase [Arcanobacterium sp.]MDD7505006.1 SMC family ATPase [Actinomycetaceae bacterium]MDY6143337.1 SMC family ATPase [Arcanobacterium sp.]
MRFRYLEMTAIGPFHEHVAIDFDALTSRGTFLIEGPTGSGKSTIIDAIVFALYGNVSGAESTKDRMRSRFATPYEESRVTLVFTTSAGTFKITRNPKWERAKAKGNGTTTVKAKAHLWRVENEPESTGNWVSIQSLGESMEDIGREIERTVGMKRSEFVQTVVLPQGEFATFLRLSSLERHKILEKVFGTQHYTEFTQYLSAQARTAHADVQDAFEDYHRSVDSWLNNKGFTNEQRDAFGVKAEDVFSAGNAYIGGSDNGLAEFVEDHNTALLERANTEAANAERADQELRMAREQLHHAENLSKILSERATLLERLAALQDQDSEIATLEARIRAAQRAQVPYEHIKLVHKRAQELVRHRDSLVTCMENALAAASKLAHDPCATAAADLLERATADSDQPASLISALAETSNKADEHELLRSLHAILDPLQTEFDAVTAQLGTDIESLTQLIELENAQATLTEDIEALAAECRITDEELDSARQAEAELPARRIELERARDEARTLAAQLDFNEKTLKEAQRHVDLLSQQTEIAEQLSVQGEVLRKAIAHYEQLQATRNDLTNRWIRSTAALLADSLEDDRACPVCGSTAHPAPAQMPPDGVTRDQVVEAENEARKASEAVNAGRVELEQLRERNNVISSAIDGSDVQMEHGTLDNLAQKVDASREAVGILQQLEATLESLEKEKAARSARIQMLSEKLAEGAGRLSSLRERYSQSDKALVEARGEAESISTRVKHLANLHHEVTQVASVFTTLHTELERMSDSIRERDEAISISGFTSADDIERAQLSSAVIEQYTTTINEHRSSLSAVTARLAAPEIVDASTCEQPDLPSLEAREAERHLQAQTARTAATQTAVFARQALEAAETIAQKRIIWKKKVGESLPITRLAEIASGGAASRLPIPLHIWVLMKRFDAVIDTANTYLQQISSGRYLLERADDYKRNQMNGLSLAIRDLHTADDSKALRPTASLSGGETFFTSLCLALGLAEVVRAENGGIQIGTLLIDEGFGSLSDDVRDALMDALSVLTRNGRSIGIISHVSELKQQIPTRITVEPRGDGTSSLRVLA